MPTLAFGDYLALAGIALAVLLWAVSPSPILRVVACALAFALFAFVFCQLGLSAWAQGPKVALIAGVTLVALAIAWSVYFPTAQVAVKAPTKTVAQARPATQPSRIPSPLPPKKQVASSTLSPTMAPTAAPEKPTPIAETPSSDLRPPASSAPHQEKARLQPSSAPLVTSTDPQKATVSDSDKSNPSAQPIYAPTAPVPGPPMDYQSKTLLGLIQQAVTETNSHEWWLSAIFARGAGSYDGIPGQAPMDYPSALKELARQGHVTILEEIHDRQPYQGFKGPITSNDIRFSIP